MADIRPWPRGENDELFATDLRSLLFVLYYNKKKRDEGGGFYGMPLQPSTYIMPNTEMSRYG